MKFGRSGQSGRFSFFPKGTPTHHLVVTSCKGFVSERCEINGQIKADNALLRELKATVRKLTQAEKIRPLPLRKPWRNCGKI